jgi:7-cyano-7-deazaguanine synthase
MNDRNDKCVVLYSGGLDSTVLLYYLDKFYNGIVALAFDYNQKHRRELDAAREITERKGIPLRVIELNALNQTSPSALTRPDINVPHGHFQDPIQKATVVPNRNMIMLSLAVAYALNIGAETVAMAAHKGDSAIYPDCRPSFFNAFQSTLYAQNINVGLLVPFLDLDKKYIVNLGKELNVPIERTWSCYEGQETPCGKCGACVERQEAMK